MPTKVRENGRKPLLPIARLLAKSRISPNFFTLIGLLITIFAGFLYGKGIFPLAGITLIVAGLFDILDGDIARISNKVTKFGAFLDSTARQNATVKIEDSVPEPASQIMPDLHGLSLRRALRILQPFGCRVMIEGSGMVKYQHPKAGSIIVGDECVLMARDRSEKLENKQEERSMYKLRSIE